MVMKMLCDSRLLFSFFPLKPQRYQSSKYGMMNLFKRRLMNLGGWTDISEDGTIFQISCTDAHNLTIHIASVSVSYFNVTRSVSLLL